MTFFRLKQVAIGLAVAAVASGCATYHYMRGGNRQEGQFPGNTLTIELVPDGNGCKKSAAPDAAFAQGGGTIVWRVTNKCGRTVTVTIKDVKEKHTFGGKYPFKPKPLEREILDGQTQDITGEVLASNEVSQDDKGFHVYRYKIRIRPGGDDDPEIIIEWP